MSRQVGDSSELTDVVITPQQLEAAVDAFFALSSEGWDEELGQIREVLAGVLRAALCAVR